MTAEEIARGLTEAQRRMVLGEYNPNLTGGRLSKVWHNLRKRGLAGPRYTGLTPLGLEVRDHLLAKGATHDHT